MTHRRHTETILLTLIAGLLCLAAGVVNYCSMDIKLEPEFQKADNLLIILISGPPQDMVSRMEMICADMRRRGIRPETEHYLGGITTQIITPIWNGKKY